MGDKGKAVEVYGKNMFDQDHSSSSGFPCTKHPSPSSVGICSSCLKERLAALISSGCGEQRLSSCSCAEGSPNRNSCSNTDVGSVGRISFLIENDQKNESLISSPSTKAKRSDSSCVEIERKRGFWRIGRFFMKKKEKRKEDIWVVDYMGVSSSLCNFRKRFFGSEDGTFSGGRSSISAARSSGVNCGLLHDPDRKSEAETRKSGFDAAFMDSERVDISDSGFIDLKFDFPEEPKPEFIISENGYVSDSASGFSSMKGDFPAQDHRGSYYERGVKRSRKSFKKWRWIFRQNPSISAEKKKENGEQLEKPVLD